VSAEENRSVENSGVENRGVALRLLGAARDVHLACQQGVKWFGSTFRAGTTLDLVAAGERAGLLMVAYDRRRYDVEGLRARETIETDPCLRRMVGGAIYRGYLPRTNVSNMRTKEASVAQLPRMRHIHRSVWNRNSWRFAYLDSAVVPGGMSDLKGDLAAYVF
jgi:hypothetical protein